MFFGEYMTRFKLFIENFLVYGLGSVIGKIVPIIMLPIVTRLMPDTQYYGLNDMSTIIVSFGSALAVMGMYDAMFRMFFEKDDTKFKKEICSSAFFFTIITSVILFSILVVFRDFFSSVFFGDSKYGMLIMLTAVSILIGSTNTIVGAPTRMQNKRLVYLVINIMSPIISYSVSVPLLLKGYYIIALPLASIVSALVIETIFIVINKQWFSIKSVNKAYIKQMLIIGLPLLPNFLIYWIFNSSDRLMIGKLLDNSQVGIYGIGARIGQMSQIVYTAFAGGWQYFAFSTMKDKDQVKMTSNIYEYLGVLTFTVTIIITSLIKVIFSVFFEGDYVKGNIVAPYLFLAPLLLMLYQTASNQLLVVKKTWPQMIVLFGGAVVNIVLNFMLIPLLGIEGAAVATLMGYVVSNVACVLLLRKMQLLLLGKRFIICVLIMVIFFLIWRFFLRDFAILSLSIGIICILIMILLYKKDLQVLLVKNRGNCSE